MSDQKGVTNNANDNSDSSIMTVLKLCIGAIGDDGKTNVGDSPIDCCCCCPKYCGKICRTGRFFPLIKDLKDELQIKYNLLNNVTIKIVDDKSAVMLYLDTSKNSNGMNDIYDVLDKYQLILMFWLKNIFRTEKYYNTNLKKIGEKTVNELIEIFELDPNILNDKDISNIIIEQLFRQSIQRSVQRAVEQSINQSTENSSYCNPIKCCKDICMSNFHCCKKIGIDNFYYENPCIADYNKYKTRIFKELYENTMWKNVFNFNIKNGDLIEFKEIIANTKLSEMIESFLKENGYNIRNIINKRSVEFMKHIVYLTFAEPNKDPIELKRLKDVPQEDLDNWNYKSILVYCEQCGFNNYSEMNEIKSIFKYIQNLKEYKTNVLDLKIFMNNLIDYRNYDIKNICEFTKYHYSNGGKIWEIDRKQIYFNIWALWIDKIKKSEEQLTIIANKIRSYRKCVNGTTLCCLPFLLIIAILIAIGYAIYIQIHG
jgi:hypothetical protein